MKAVFTKLPHTLQPLTQLQHLNVSGEKAVLTTCVHDVVATSQSARQLLSPGNTFDHDHVEFSAAIAQLRSLEVAGARAVVVLGWHVVPVLPRVADLSCLRRVHRQECGGPRQSVQDTCQWHLVCKRRGWQGFSH